MDTKRPPLPQMNIDISRISLHPNLAHVQGDLPAALEQALGQVLRERGAPSGMDRHVTLDQASLSVPSTHGVNDIARALAEHIHARLSDGSGAV